MTGPVDCEFVGCVLPEFAYGGAKQRDLRRSAPDRQLVGVMESSDRERDRSTQTDIVKCCHCGRFWSWVRGSGRLRSMCLRCNGVTCGPLCPCGENCITEEEVLDRMAAGLPWCQATTLPRTVKARTGGGVLLG